MKDKSTLHEPQLLIARAKFICPELNNAQLQLLLREVLEMLPELSYKKLEKCRVCGVPYMYQCTCDAGFQAAINEVTTLLQEFFS